MNDKVIEILSLEAHSTEFLKGALTRLEQHRDDLNATIKTIVEILIKRSDEYELKVAHHFVNDVCTKCGQQLTEENEGRFCKLQ